MKDGNSEPQLPPALDLLLKAAHHVSDRAWSGLQAYLVVQSILAVAWASITNVATWPAKIIILIAISTVGIVTGFQWSLLVTRMWQYHLEYAEQLRKLTSMLTVEANGPGALAWNMVDAAIDAQWRQNKYLKAAKDWSGNQYVLFSAPLILSMIHMFMLAWVLWFVGDNGRYFAIAVGVLFFIGLAAVSLICKPILVKTYGQEV